MHIYREIHTYVCAWYRMEKEMKEEKNQFYFLRGLYLVELRGYSWLYSEITSGSLREPHGMLGIEL